MGNKCSDCPPMGYPTDKTRCEGCEHRFGWPAPQLIDTVPKDNGPDGLRRRILAWHPLTGKWRVVWWTTDSYARRPRPYWKSGEHNISIQRADQPTHWVPLPPPLD